MKNGHEMFHHPGSSLRFPTKEWTLNSEISLPAATGEQSARPAAGLPRCVGSGRGARQFSSRRQDRRQRWQVLSTERETISASTATSWSLKPAALDASVMVSFFDGYMLRVVAYARS
jgi:hypothetical protein